MNTEQPETLSAVTTNGTDAVLGMEYNGAEGHEEDTVASIVAEMRETWTDTPPCILSDLADRIEAAAERERDEDRQLAAIAESDEAFARCARCDRPERAPVNADALREALKESTALLAVLPGDEYEENVMRQIDRNADVLSEPARNCDRFTDCNSAWKAYNAIEVRERFHGFDFWLFAPAEGGAE